MVITSPAYLLTRSVLRHPFLAELRGGISLFYAFLHHLLKNGFVGTFPVLPRVYGVDDFQEGRC